MRFYKILPLFYKKLFIVIYKKTQYLQIAFYEKPNFWEEYTPLQPAQCPACTIFIGVFLGGVANYTQHTIKLHVSYWRLSLVHPSFHALLNQEIYVRHIFQDVFWWWMYTWFYSLTIKSRTAITLNQHNHLGYKFNMIAFYIVTKFLTGNTVVIHKT